MQYEALKMQFEFISIEQGKWWSESEGGTGKGQSFSVEHIFDGFASNFFLYLASTQSNHIVEIDVHYIHIMD